MGSVSTAVESATWNVYNTSQVTTGIFERMGVGVGVPVGVGVGVGVGVLVGTGVVSIPGGEMTFISLI